jgi:hypothetical protein
MAYRVNPYVDRAADFKVADTAKQSRETSLRTGINPTWHTEPVSKREPETPSRTLNVILDSANAVSIAGNEVTYMLNMPHLGKLKPGTIMYVRCIETNQSEETDWAISGLNTWSFSLMGQTIYNLRARFIRSGDNVYSPQGGLAVPMCVSLKSDDVFFNNRLTLTRLNSTGSDFVNTPAFYCRLHLLFKEP